MKTIYVGMQTAFMAALGILCCGITAFAQELIPIRIGWQPTTTVEAQIAHTLAKTDILERNGLRGQFTMFSFGPAVKRTWARLHLQARDEGNDERPGVPGGICRHVLRTAVAMVRFQDGDARDGAIGIAMTGVVTGPISGTLTLALESLDIACRDLDAAVLAAPHVHGDDVVASASLIALLHRVVTARRQVRQLELDVKAEIGNRARAATVS